MYSQHQRKTLQVMSRLHLLLSAVSQVLRYVKNNNINKMPIDHNITPGRNSKPRLIIKVLRFPRKTLLFSYVVSPYFFRKIFLGDFSETIRQISKISPGTIGIYLKFVSFWNFWNITSGCELGSIFWLFRTFYVHESSL